MGENNWAWGKDDVLDAGNLMTASSVKAALAAVESGQIIGLSHVWPWAHLTISPIQTSYVMTLSRTSKNMEDFLSEKMGATSKIGFYLERIGMTTHVSPTSMHWATLPSLQSCTTV